MPTISGLITGTLGYSLKREFLANAIALRDVESYTFEVYSVDMLGQNASTVQSGIKRQFSNFYSGDINVTVFETQHNYGFPSDGFRAGRFSVNVEIRKPVQNLSSTQPELASGYYAGLNASFFTTYAPYLNDFKETFSFATNGNGNREFNHEVGFGLRTGWGVGGNTVTGRKAYAQTIASSILAEDKNTPFGLTTMIGMASTVADSGQTRNYFSESYDLMRNTYNFSRKRELLPFDVVSGVANFTHSLTMNSDGTTDVAEKAIVQGAISFAQAKAASDSSLASSYNRCSGVYSQFYNANVMLQDPQYSGLSIIYGLQTTPIKTIKTNDARAITAGYEVTYSNNPAITGSYSMISQTVEFDIDMYDRLDANHTFDFTVNRVRNDSGQFITLMNAVTGSSPQYMSNYYSTYYPSIASLYPDFNLVKIHTSWPNIKTKGVARLSYSNNPSFFVQYDGLTFRILDYSVDDKKPVDIVNEYKVVNRPTNTSVLNYGYQTEKGEVVVNMRISLGKQSNTFYPDGVGNFTVFEGVPLSRWLQAIYKYGGQLLMQQFDYPTMGLNWFISDSRFTVDTEGNMTVQINYTYTVKKRLATNFP